MANNEANNADDTEIGECDGEKVVTMMDVLQEQQEFEDDANAVLGASDDKNCTYSKGYIKRQALYACLTCCSDAKFDPSKRAAVCLACSLTCHDNHELIELYTKRNFRCDCGNPKFNSHPCQFTPDKTNLNDDNKYNQNFSGIYCVCHRPYPDPEAQIEDEMIQCIICEDWLHSQHLEADVPPNNQYSEMICKACMEEYNFLHDYSCYAVNSLENSIVNITTIDDVTLNETDEIKANRDSDNVNITDIEIPVEKTQTNSKIEETTENNSTDKTKDATENENTETIMAAESDMTSSDATKDLTDVENTELKDTDENEDQECTDVDMESEDAREKCDEKITDTANADNKQKDNENEQPTGNKDLNNEKMPSSQPESKENELEKDSLMHNEECLDNVTENNTNNENIVVEETEQPTEDKDLNNEKNSGSQAESKENEFEKDSRVHNEECLENATENNENIVTEETDKNEPQSSIDTNKKNECLDNTLENNVNNENKMAEKIDENEPQSPIDRNTENECSDNTTENNDKNRMTEDKHELQTSNDIIKGNENTSIKDTNNIVEVQTNNIKNSDNSENNKTTKEQMADINTEVTNGTEKKCESDAVSGTESKLKDNKRKLSTEIVEMDDVTKKVKLDDKKCERPRGVKKIYKGATFWGSNFRQKLCTCTECITMYKDLSVLFILDPEDTTTAYEALGKEKEDGEHFSQYEKGMQALSSLDRVQQINALTEYNKMRDKLLEYLKSFKDRKEVVKEEDIKAFFAGMKPHREPDGVYFCR